MSNLPTIIPEATEWATMKEMSRVLLDTRFLPQAIKTPQQAVAIMLKGRELKMPAMQALSQINVIQGKPTLSAEAMLALIYRECPSAEIVWQEYTNEVVSAKVRRHKGTDFQSFAWSIEDAQKAGLAGGHSWKKYPRALLRSRCVSEFARAVFPDCIMGCSYTPEEMGAEVNEDGEVIDIVETAPIEPVEPKSDPLYMATKPQVEELFAALKSEKFKVADRSFAMKVSAALHGKPFNDEELDRAYNAAKEVEDEKAE